MYEPLKEWLLWFVRVPPEPLDPMGDVRALRVFRASPNYYRYRVLLWLLKMPLTIAIGIAVLAYFFLATPPRGAGPLELLIIGGELLVLMMFPFHLVVSFFMLRLDYEMRWYKITDRSLRIREGVLIVHEMTMTFANIQNISITQGPIQRLLGIADVRVDTAGGGGAAAPSHGAQPTASGMHTGYFRGVDSAEEIRDLMLERLREARSTGLGDLDDHVEAASALPQLPAGAGFSPEALSLLTRLRDEARGLRQAAEAFRDRQGRMQQEGGA